MAYTANVAFGPFLNYQDLNLAANAWTGSILVVSYGNQAPNLSTDHLGHQFTPQPVCLDSFQNYSFWRWQLDLQLQPVETAVDYRISTEWAKGQTYQKSFRFFLPGASQCWHWGFHSCNGFSHGVEASWELAASSLWKDVLDLHSRTPLHCMVGGGDQLYQDGFFKEPSMVEWLKIKDRKVRETVQVSATMDAEISHFMFHHYCNWFSKEGVAEAFASIPQVMTWDDHDLLDGWGSYPEQLQNCPVFQHAFHVGRRFYLAFQQHTSLAQAHQQANLFGAGQSFSQIRMMGHNVALVAPDVRAERTRTQVVSPASWQLIFSKMDALPTSVRHVVMLTTIPVVYPKIPLTEKAMGLVSTLGRTHAIDAVLNKTGLWTAVKGKAISNFEEPELLDDLLDHWTSDFHCKEREMLIGRLQTFAQTRHIRVTFVSGDVHVGGLGRLYTHPKTDLRKDFRFMPQVVSSAIMNAPPPMAVVNVLHTCSNAHMSGIDKSTKEKMVRIFKPEYPKTDKLLPKRNWATFRELPPGQQLPILSGALSKDPPPQAGDLLITLRVETDHKQSHLPVKEYPIPVPSLEPLGGAYGVVLPGNPTIGAAMPSGLQTGHSVPGQGQPQAGLQAQNYYPQPVQSGYASIPQGAYPQAGQVSQTGPPQYGTGANNGSYTSWPSAQPQPYAASPPAYPQGQTVQSYQNSAPQFQNGYQGQQQGYTDVNQQLGSLSLGSNYPSQAQYGMQQSNQALQPSGQYYHYQDQYSQQPQQQQQYSSPSSYPSSQQYSQQSHQQPGQYY